MTGPAHVASRLILLRRPPVVRPAGVPFVPLVDLREVDRRWGQLVATNPAFFDGRLLHVFSVVRNGHGGATLHVVECAYRHWAVGLTGLDTGVRALGVKGLVIAEGCVLVGRRSEHVAAYPDCWEFAPGGGLEPGCEPRRMLERELLEETGLECGIEARVCVRALLLDASVRSWEIVHQVRLPKRVEPAPRSREYSALRWVPIDALVGAGPMAKPALESLCDGSVTDCAAAMVRLLAPTHAGSVS